MLWAQLASTVAIGASLFGWPQQTLPVIHTFSLTSWAGSQLGRALIAFLGIGHEAAFNMS